MNVKIKLDTKSNQLVVSATTSRRKYTSQERKTFQWKDVCQLIESYSLPDGYVLGSCNKRNQIVDNSHDERLKAEWVFSLKNISPEPTKPIRQRRRSVTKKPQANNQSEA